MSVKYNTFIYYTSKGSFILFIGYLLTFLFQRRHIFNLDDSLVDASFNEWLSISFYLSDFFLIVLLGLFSLIIAYKLKRKEKIYIGIINGRPLLFSIFALVIVAFVSLIGNDLIGSSIAEYRFLRLCFALFLFVYVFLEINTEKRLKITAFTLVFSALMQSIIAILQFYFQKSLGLSFLGEPIISPDVINIGKVVLEGSKIIRPLGTLPHANVLAFTLLAALFFCIISLIRMSHVEQSTKLKKFFYGLTFISTQIIATALFLTLSRVVTMVFLFGISTILVSVFILKKFKLKQFRKVRLTFIVLLLTALIFSSILLPLIRTRLTLSDREGDQALTSRLDLTSVANNFISSSAIYGVGLGNFVPRMLKEHPGLESWRYQPVHNLFLLITSEIGIAGLVLFFLMIFFIIRNIAYLRKKDSGFTLLNKIFLFYFIFAIQVVSFFDHYMWSINQGLMLFWISLGIILSYSRLFGKNQIAT